MKQTNKNFGLKIGGSKKCHLQIFISISNATLSSYEGQDSTFRYRGHRSYSVNPNIALHTIKIIDDPKKSQSPVAKSAKVVDTRLDVLRQQLRMGPVNQLLMITCPQFEVRYR